MSEIKEQFCEFCGESLGEPFKHSRMLDGPLVCAAKECNRDASRLEREDEAEREDAARQDRFNRY